MVSHETLLVQRSFTRSWSEVGYNYSMFYTYILQSQKDKSYYCGSTKNLKKRFRVHNQKGAKYSSSKAPFDLIWYGAFKTKQKSQEFEKYLKTGSGFAFRNKRLA